MSILSNYREASGIIYTSGATSAPGDAPTQIRGCFEKLKAILEEAGSSFDNVLKVNVYLPIFYQANSYPVQNYPTLIEIS